LKYYIENYSFEHKTNKITIYSNRNIFDNPDFFNYLGRNEFIYFHDEQSFTELDKNNQGLTTRNIIINAIFVVLFGILIFYVCKKYMVRRIYTRINDDVSSRISNVVSIYMVMKDRT
jgi:hypothetical protein